MTSESKAKTKSKTKARASGRPVPRPFLKWAGGKAQLLDDIHQRLPARFGAYFEPFLGGGAVFFHLRRQGLIREATLCDINEELIATWTAIRDDVDGVLKALDAHKNTEAHYYKVRGKDPARLDPTARAARIIFLNKTCFNGLYRVNSKGEFNVPYNHNPRTSFRDEDNLRAVSAALQGVNLLVQDFAETLKTVEKGDFVYLDPPYQPRSRTASFTAYTAGGFDEEDQDELNQGFLDLTRRGAFAMLSNSDTDFTAKLYDFGESGDIKVDLIKASRFINSKASGRGKINEFLVCNYPPDPKKNGRVRGY